MFNKKWALGEHEKWDVYSCSRVAQENTEVEVFLPSKEARPFLSRKGKWFLLFQQIPLGKTFRLEVHPRENRGGGGKKGPKPNGKEPAPPPSRGHRGAEKQPQRRRERGRDECPRSRGGRTGSRYSILEKRCMDSFYLRAKGGKKACLF